MPASHQSSTANVAQPAILLLEKYDALAAAICSALKKFAPHHAPVVAPSIDEAETLAGKTKPDLFIIDFDPSYPGLSEFLQKMRKTLADARIKEDAFRAALNSLRADQLLAAAMAHESTEVAKRAER